MKPRIADLLISKEELPAKLHDSVINALEVLRREGIYHHDVVSAGKMQYQVQCANEHCWVTQA